AVWVDARTGAVETIPAPEIADTGEAETEPLPCIIRVDETLSALQRLSTYWRDKFAPKLRVIGITGSIGKTTTKELTAQVLGTHYTVLKNEGNQNNEIGVP